MISTIALILLGSALAPPAPTPCEGLRSLSLRDATIKAAELVPAGLYTAPAGGQQQPPQPVQLAAHCRVNAILKPSSDSEIEIEVWLPSENWNGKFEAVQFHGRARTLAGIRNRSRFDNRISCNEQQSGHDAASLCLSRACAI